MSKKPGSRTLSSDSTTRSKKMKTIDALHKLLEESGLTLNHAPDKCVASLEIIHVVRNIKKNLQKQFDYPRNVSEVFTCFAKQCKDLDVFKQYLFPNIVRRTDEGLEDHPVKDSVIKILLNIPMLQNKLIDYIFEKAMDLAVGSKCAPWIQMIMKCFSTLDTIVNTEKIATNIVNLLDVTTEKTVRLEIICSIPDIIGDQEHENIATEMSRFLSEDHELIPAILDCITHLCLSEVQYEQLQRKTLSILATMPKCIYFPNFVKFLLLPDRATDSSSLEAVQGLRNALGWQTSAASSNEIATSQVLTASAIRKSILSSKIVGNAWIKAFTSCKVSTDHKALDVIILLLLYSTTEDRQKQVENMIRKLIKLDLLKEDLLDDAFEKYKPIFKEYLPQLIELSNSLLKIKSDPLVESFASHIYTLTLSELDDCRQTIIAELLQVGLDRKECVMSILRILNNVANKDMSLLKPQSLQMLTLLDRMDGMSLTEIKAVMNLVCGLACTYENSIIRDDIHMIIRKELGSSVPTIKVQGILAGVHAVKYLMTCKDNEDETVNFPDDISYSSVKYLSEGPLREAAQIIELITRSTKQFPDMIACFYDELSGIVISATHINKHFMAWLIDAVTNDLQQNFIVDTPIDRVGRIKLSLQYCLNADSEMDEVLAINIAGLTLEANDTINVAIISPLFQLIQTLNYKQHDGNLSTIDALLGCPVIMPTFDIDLIEDMDNKDVSNILDCLVHCANWFRELLNAFATQDDEALKPKILQKVLQTDEIESTIMQILLKTKILYKPPVCTFDIAKYTSQQIERKKPKAQAAKQKTQTRAVQDETAMPETLRSQGTQANNASVKQKLEAIHSIPLRNLNTNLLNLFNNDLSNDRDVETELNIRSFKYLVKCTNNNMEAILISNIKKKSFLTKKEIMYEPDKAAKCAQSFSEVLPKLVEHLKVISSYIEDKTTENSQNESGFMFTSEMIEYLDCFEGLLKMFTTYFKWIGFKNHHVALFKSSLRTIADSNETKKIVSLKDLTITVAKNLQKYEKNCLQLSTAVALIELLKAIQEHSDSTTVLKILREMANGFLSQIWKTADGAHEKGLHFNQSVDRLSGIYFLNSEVIQLKSLILELMQDIQTLKGRNDHLNKWKCINKSNFPILFRNIGTAVHDSAKSRLSDGLTNNEHLEVWKDVVQILKYMSEISKTLESRNNLTAFFKKSLPILKLFLSQGIPIIELQFKNNTQEVLEILKVMQQSTRFLQSLCCHSRLKHDNALMSKVPFMRQVLETLIYKVKAALAANKCSEAFWLGNLKNKNIHGEVIASQQSESEESIEDCDEQLPEDENSDDSDEEMLNPESKSLSDVI